MTFIPYAAETKAVVALLEGGLHETVEDLANAVLETAWALFQGKRGKFTVVSQLAYQPAHRTKAEAEKAQMLRSPGLSPYVGPGDPRLTTVALGWFPTQAQAHAAAASMFTSSQSREEWKSMVVPVWHGTPAKWHETRKVNEE